MSTGFGWQKPCDYLGRVSRRGQAALERDGLTSRQFSIKLAVSYR